jgi:hypothetical protein
LGQQQDEIDNEALGDFPERRHKAAQVPQAQIEI